MHILLVEDDLDTREVISAGLDCAGHQVTETGDANEALRLLRLHRDIQLVIADVHLGGRLSGLQVVEIMRERLYRTYCILMSGDWESLKQARPENASILRKPYGFEELLQIVNTVQARQAPAGPAPLDAATTAASLAQPATDIPPA
jgi:two-component system, response regulator PdtaR